MTGAYLNKRSLSFWTVILLSVIAFTYRTYHSDLTNRPLKITSWDALGYYQYLPATFIYGDIEKLKWFEEKEAEYDLSNGYIYQFSQLDNGNRVGKYFSGVAIMQSPFFLIGHAIALTTDYKNDGFSPPYQYSIAYGALIYFVIALFVLRKVLRKFFDELTSSITLLVFVLATNLLQYTAIEGGMSHGYIFLLYALSLLYTIKWHEHPTRRNAMVLGFILGFTIVCRPTEAVIIFIPLLWGIHDKESWKQKIALIKQHKSQLLWVALFAALAITPQIFYWKYVTGSFVHNVGSKWVFFDPWFRVIFGFEKGWFVYTPITIFFIMSLFFIKKRTFKLAVITFTVLNIWVIMAWHEWRYGASYSTRALVQSLPVFTLAFAAFVHRIRQSKMKIPAMILAIYLIVVNIIQIRQYNQGILLADGMNYEYYKAVYLNLDPDPEVRKLAIETPNN